MFRDQLVITTDINGDGIVRDQPFQLHRKDRESFTQTERCSQVLTKFEQSLRFLSRGSDGSQERCFVRMRLLFAGETRGGLKATLHL